LAQDAAAIQARIDALDAAMGAGIRRVRYGDTEMEYFSIAEMQAARSALVNDLAVAGGTAPRPRMYRTRSPGRCL